MKQISIFVVGVATAFACASAPAQDLTAGKTPPQLFHSDCAECHRSPSGLARTRDVRALADFLREHYTTKSETAGALAAYVSSFAAGGPAARNRGADATAPATGYREIGRRNRREGEAIANEADAPSPAKPAKDPAGRHRRTTSVSGEGEKGRVDSDGEVPRPSGSILTAPGSSKSHARTHGREPRDARLRSDLPSERGSENATEEAGKTGAPTARKRRNRVNGERATPDARANADKPLSATTGPTIRGMPRQGDVSPTSAPTVPPAVTSP